MTMEEILNSAIVREAIRQARREENEACAKLVLQSEMFCEDEQKLKKQLVSAIRARVK